MIDKVYRMASSHTIAEPALATDPKENWPAEPGDRVRVLLPLPLAEAYDYRVPNALSVDIGSFVSVPLGQRMVAGVVWGQGTGTVDETKLRDIEGVFDVPPMPDETRRFVEWVASYTLSIPGTVLRMAMSVPAAFEPPTPISAYRATTDLPPDIRITATRRRVLDVLDGGPPRQAKELAREAGCGTGVVKSMATAGLLETVYLKRRLPSPPNPDNPGPKLSKAQKSATETLAIAVDGSAYSATLLDGVTGSGKTEVYFEAIAEALRRGRQVLVLLPEIALSPQWLNRFQQRFGVRPTEWHSDLTSAQRRANWRAVAEGEVRVVVGARSALFLPFGELGLIVVDEEHEGAYKQEDGVIYHARDMAVARAHLGDFPIILISATPSIESLVNVERGRYAVCHLPDRFGGAALPVIDAIDMRETPPPSGRFLAPVMLEALVETLGRGEQAMLFLNRRGYAPLTLCRSCGHRFECPNCTTWLVEHRLRGRLICHHCGYMARRPPECPVCGAADSLTPCGPGVERIAEEVDTVLPGARWTVVTSDTVSGPKAMSALVDAMGRGEVNLLIGTQVVAKGHHFPKLTLVGVVDADLGFNTGDFRAFERTYQLLDQVAGRAGREDLPGRVLMQSYEPENPVLQALIHQDRERFLAGQIEARRRAGLPPFGRLAAIIVSGRDRHQTDQAARSLAQTAPRVDGVEVIGPAEAPLSLLRGRFRRRLLVKATRQAPLQELVRDWLGRTDLPSSVRVAVDVDPFSFL
jgi:primosomal protein N' (replication factor Y)